MNRSFIQDARVKAVGIQHYTERKVQYLYYAQVKICWIWWTWSCWTTKREAMHEVNKAMDCE